MYLKQRDIFRSLDKDFVKKIMDIAEPAGLKAGEILFKAGDGASWFYVLLKGRIKLSLGRKGHLVYTVSHGGEAFGWSSLVGRKSYSASAQCLAETQLLKFEKSKLEALAEADTANGMMLYRNLSVILGDRLLHSYTFHIPATDANEISSFGTGQTMDLAETETER